MLSVVTKSMPLVDLVATMPMTQLWIQSRASRCLHCWKRQNHRQNNSQWTRLHCRLSSPRCQCAAVVVHNRYIVILGGDTGRCHNLSSVDIMDTAPHHDSNNNNGEPTIVAGPSMNMARYAFGAAVMDNQIFVVAGWVDEMHGGWVDHGRSTSVESLLFQRQPQDKDHTNSNSNVSFTYPNS